MPQVKDLQCVYRVFEGGVARFYKTFLCQYIKGTPLRFTLLIYRDEFSGEDKLVVGNVDGLRELQPLETDRFLLPTFV